MNTVEMRLSLRLPQDMFDYLQAQSRLKKLSFVGLFLLYLREQMNRERKG